MNLQHSNDMKVVVHKLARDYCFGALGTLNYVDCITFFVLIIFI